MAATVAIVGRPNVGKSTLFNRILRERKAIVDKTDGVTRDRVYANVEWSGKHFTLIDTGGIMIHPKDQIEDNVRKQALIAIEEADLILFLLDGPTGITHIDHEIARILKRSDKKILPVVNKIDDVKHESMIWEFHNLGLGDPLMVSALLGRATGDVLDEVIKRLPEEMPRQELEPDIKLALLGMPNAGKSTMANAFLGMERHIVTDIPGTTRDSVDSTFKYHGKQIQIVDTAGLRKRTRISDSIEYYSLVRSKKTIEHSDVCILIVDISKGFSRQDVQIIREIQERGKGLVIALNKWDLIEKETRTAGMYLKSLHYEYPVLKHYPVFFISALERKRLLKVLDEALAVRERLHIRIPTSELNDVFGRIIANNPPPSVRSKYGKIKYVAQVRTSPPHIAFFCNEPSWIQDHYKRFLESKLRELYDLSGVPLKVSFKKK
ncbi:MAG: GTPase Der [Marinimicrobia bacterium 46_47]|nr:MAG: GTPase Der [Marinimicrobia bacterium 46_47]KUK93297.1 MAG: GTPase Der [Marinimicrobia bacterium 46_43]HBY18029.1 ribosome biogenesis GTPase Der [Candidatus Neomarinimicrobiota bacterium]